MAGPRIADALKERLAANGCAFVDGPKLRELEKLVLVQGKSGTHPNKDWIGKNAGLIGRQIGVRAGASCGARGRGYAGDQFLARVDVHAGVFISEVFGHGIRDGS